MLKILGLNLLINFIAFQKRGHPERYIKLHKKALSRKSHNIKVIVHDASRRILHSKIARIININKQLTFNTKTIKVIDAILKSLYLIYYRLQDFRVRLSAFRLKW